MKPRPRYKVVDIVRGIAIIAMIIYHATWFADDARLIAVDMGALSWRAFQKSIAGTFFALVGLSLHLAATPSLNVRRYLYRLGKLLLCAAIVTTTSVVLNPNRLVTFGILHAIAACSVLALPFLRLPSALLGAVGLPVILLGVFYVNPVFNDLSLAWIGMGTRTPPTFDHQPLIPWFGIVLVGIIVGRNLPARLAAWRPDGPIARLLALGGRWSLWIYMAHVPILMGGVMLLQQWLR